jgi:aspartate racemase
MRFTKTIGILGGVGPSASAYALQRIISICQLEYGSVQDDDFPNIVLTSFSTPHVTEKGVSDKYEFSEEVKNSLNSGYRTLSVSGAKLVYTACNTLSLKTNIFTELSMRHINIIEQTVKYISSQRPDSSVRVLSSASTRHEKLYEDHLVDMGVKNIPVSDATQTIVDGLILAAMSGSNTSIAKSNLLSLCKELLVDCDIVVLGCTELSLLAEQYVIGQDIIDPQELALRVLLKEARS